MTLDDNSARHDRRVNLAAKAVFVAVCCTSAALMVALSGDPTSANRNADRITAVVGAVLLLVSLAAAIRLGSRRRQSESWAVLAYGSWMTMPCMLFLNGVLHVPYLWDVGAPGIAFAFGSFFAHCGFIWGGLRSALRGRWWEVLRWWLSSFLLIVLYVIWGFVVRSG